jgi:hypothetical protein
MLRARRACALVAALLALSGCAGRYFHEAGTPPEPPRLEPLMWRAWTLIVRLIEAARASFSTAC